MTIKTESRNAELVSFFVQHSKGDLGHTRLMKLLYLADYESRRFLGKPISTLNYIWHYYGPFDPAVETVVEGLRDTGVVQEFPVMYPNGKRGYLYQPGPTQLASSFEPADMAILSYVCDQYSAVGLRELLDDIVYETEPMITAKAQDAKGQPLNMAMIDNTKANELGTSFAELLNRSWDVRCGNYLTHAEAMALVDSEMAALAA